MADQHSEDEAFSTDMQLIEDLAAGLRSHRWPGDSDTIVEFGDLENTSILAVRNGVFTYETRDRGQRSVRARYRRRRRPPGRRQVPPTQQGAGQCRDDWRQAEIKSGRRARGQRKQGGRADEETDNSLRRIETTRKPLTLQPSQEGSVRTNAPWRNERHQRRCPR